MVDELLRAKVQQFYELVALSPHLFIFFGLMIAGKRVGTRGLSGLSPIVIFCTFLPIRLVISIEKCNFAERFLFKSVVLVGVAIDYWSASQNGNMAGGVSGNSKRLHPHSDGDLYYGDCVRLVHEVMH